MADYKVSGADETANARDRVDGYRACHRKSGFHGRGRCYENGCHGISGCRAGAVHLRDDRRPEHAPKFAVPESRAAGKGVANVVAVVVIGSALAQVYRALTPMITGPLHAGPPTYDLEIWI